MKVAKFGEMKIDEKNRLSITGFHFVFETKEEEKEDPNDAKKAITSIINYLLDHIGGDMEFNHANIKAEESYFTSERMVSEAISRAQHAAKNGDDKG